MVDNPSTSVPKASAIAPTLSSTASANAAATWSPSLQSWPAKVAQLLVVGVLADHGARQLVQVQGRGRFRVGLLRGPSTTADGIVPLFPFVQKDIQASVQRVTIYLHGVSILVLGSGKHLIF